MPHLRQLEHGSLSTSLKVVQDNVVCALLGGNIKKEGCVVKAATALGLGHKRVNALINLRERNPTDPTKWTKGMRVSKKRILTPPMVNKVISFYKKETDPAADKKMIRQRTGTGQFVVHPKHWLKGRLIDLFLKFRRMNDGVVMHFKTFCKLKPFYVRKKADKDLFTCCCTMCVNMVFFVKCFVGMCHSLRPAALKAAQEQGRDVDTILTEWSKGWPTLRKASNLLPPDVGDDEVEHVSSKDALQHSSYFMIRAATKWTI
jgi:hypothetical protein